MEPVGRIVDEVPAELGIDPTKIFVINAAKHLKSVPRGKRRLHRKPNGREVSAFRFWLD